MSEKLRSSFTARQDMLSEDFEVFYYSDTHFRSVSPHAHDYYEFYFFAEGQVVMELGDRAYPLRAGDVIAVPPETVHRARVDPEEPYRRFVFWMSRGFAESLFARSPDYRYLADRAAAGRPICHFGPAAFNALISHLYTLLDEVHADFFGREELLRLHAAELMLRVNRAVYDRDHPRSRRENASLYGSVAAYIDTHLEEDLSLDRLAGTFYVSKFHLAHLFQETTGLPVHRYILKRRLAAAADALRAGSGAAEAASQAGFGDYSGFFRAFRKEYGLAPSEYAALGVPGEGPG